MNQALVGRRPNLDARRRLTSGKGSASLASLTPDLPLASPGCCLGHYTPEKVKTRGALEPTQLVPDTEVVVSAPRSRATNSKSLGADSSTSRGENVVTLPERPYGCAGWPRTSNLPPYPGESHPGGKYFGYRSRNGVRGIVGLVKGTVEP